MSCTNAYADAVDFGNFFCVDIPSEEEALLNRNLELASAPIRMALGSVDALDCTKSDAGNQFLMLLNIYLAVASYNCKCSNVHLTPEDKKMFFDAARQDLVAIRENKIEVCQGETGADWPVTGWAEQGVSEFARRDIIANDYLRNSG